MSFSCSKLFKTFRKTFQKVPCSPAIVFGSSYFAVAVAVAAAAAVEAARVAVAAVASLEMASPVENG